MEKDVELSLLIGQTIEYSITKDQHSVGVVLDKVLAKESAKDDFAVTKYLVEDNKSRAIVHIASWRVIRVVEPIEDFNEV